MEIPKKINLLLMWFKVCRSLWTGRKKIDIGKSTSIQSDPQADAAPLCLKRGRRRQG